MIRWKDETKEATSSVLRQYLPGFFEKNIDEGYTGILAESLSLMGRLFEIYFVRLIGTPNQHSKTRIRSTGRIQ